jgi:hypothetical protein
MSLDARKGTVTLTIVLPAEEVVANDDLRTFGTPAAKLVPFILSLKGAT